MIFSTEDNAYMNAHANTPRRVAEAFIEMLTPTERTRPDEEMVVLARKAVDDALPFLGFRVQRVLNSRGALRSPEEKARMGRGAGVGLFALFLVIGLAVFVPVGVMPLIRLVEQG